MIRRVLERVGRKTFVRVALLLALVVILQVWRARTYHWSVLVTLIAVAMYFVGAVAVAVVAGLRARRASPPSPTVEQHEHDT